MNADKPHEGKDHKARIVQAIADFEQRRPGTGKRSRQRKTRHRRGAVQQSQ